MIHNAFNSKILLYRDKNFQRIFGHQIFFKSDIFTMHKNTKIILYMNKNF